MTLERSGTKGACAHADQALRDEYRADPEAWESNDLSRFLDSLAAWVVDSPGYRANEGHPEPEQPDWAWVALALRAATWYE